LRWEQVVPTGLKYKARYGAVSQTYKGKVHIFGGKVPHLKNTNETFSYDLGSRLLFRFLSMR